jgi:hypothetical protein
VELKAIIQIKETKLATSSGVLTLEKKTDRERIYILSAAIIISLSSVICFLLALVQLN